MKSLLKLADMKGKYYIDLVLSTTKRIEVVYVIDINTKTNEIYLKFMDHTEDWYTFTKSDFRELTDDEKIYWL